MSTPDSKVAKAYNILYTDYAMLIGFDAIGFYYHLIWLHSRSLGKPVTFDYIKSKTFIPEEKLQILIRKLLVFKLIKKERIENSGGEKDWEFRTVTPKYISREDKSSMVADLYAKVLIDENEKQSLIDYINDTSKDTHNDDGENVADFLIKDKDFSEPSKGVGEDTPMGLLLYYYKRLGQVFGGKYISRNERMEAAHISECMKKNGDTPEMTREFFNWILERARRSNKFDQVSSLGLYPEWRKHAYHALYVKQEGDKKFEKAEPEQNISPEEEILRNIKGVFDIYKSKGTMSDGEIVEKVLRKNFSDDAIKMFMEKE